MVSKEIIFQPQYIDVSLIDSIRQYFNDINDCPFHSDGPKDNHINALGWEGCWDRNLYLEKTDNPVHTVIQKLKSDFGDFSIYDASIRYLCAPYLPHSDIRDTEWLRKAKTDNFKEGFVFLIPLWWRSNYKPATAFYSNPARLDEPLYMDYGDILPKFSPDHERDARNLSVHKIVHWQNAGDLVAWRNFQWHGSCGILEGSYARHRWIKEFISIETWSLGR